VFARIATFTGGDVDAMYRVTNERMTSGGDGFPDGVRRAMALQTGDRWQIITFFDSREAVDAAEQGFEQMGDEIPESLRGRRVAVETYEVLFDVEMIG
jgi:hypothetical protein